MSKQYFEILFVLFLFVAGCRKESDSKNTVVNYSWSYDADRDSSYIGAQVLNINTGQSTELSGNSEIRFGNDLLTPQTFPTPGYYHKKYQGYIDTGTFTYKDADGVVYTNSFAFIPKRNFPASLTSVNHTTDNAITWVGEPSRLGEEFSMCVYNIIGGNTNRHCSSGIGVDSTGCHLIADSVSTLSTGTNNAIIYMEWSRFDYISSSSPALRSITQGIYGPSKVISVN